MRHPNPLLRRAFLRAGLLLAVLLLFSCRSLLFNSFQSVDPVHVSLSKATAESITSRFRPAEAVAGKKSLTLDDCKKIALTQNLELQLARVEEITRAAIRDSNQKKMLPHLIFSGDLGERDNLGFSYSDVIGQEGLSPRAAEAAGSTGVTNFSVGHERSTWRYDLELRWSPTDTALAYFLSRSSRNDRLSAHYQRVRVAQKLVGAVEAAYYRLLTLQNLMPKGRWLKALRNRVLQETEHLFERKMKSVDEYQQVKESFLRSAQTLLTIQDNCERQRNALATAMRLSPEYRGTSGFSVAGAISAPSFRGSIAHMEITAVENRPEAVEAGLNYLNSVNDIHRTIVKFFPRISGYWKYTRDKDKFLYNKDWKEVGIRTHFDITEWLTNWDESRAARSNSVKADKEVGAVALGITSQVRQAALRYFRALRELANAEESLKISRRALETAKVRARSDDISKIQLLEVEASAMQEEIDRTLALGEANATLAELRAEMGVNYREPHPRR